MSALLTASPAADLDGYLYRIAVPYRWGDDPARVEVWAMDQARRWWLLVNGDPVRRLDCDETVLACRQAGLGSSSIRRIDALTDPFDDVAPTDRDSQPVFSTISKNRGEEGLPGGGLGLTGGGGRVLDLIQRMG